MLVRKHGPRVADRQRLRIAREDLALKPGASKCRAFRLPDAIQFPRKIRLLNRGMGLFAVKTNRLGISALLLRRARGEEFDSADYSFVVKRRANPPKPWRWEIYCACKATPVDCSPVFFESMAEAAKEGKKALADFLAK